MATSRAACHHYGQFLLDIRHLQALYTPLQKCQYKDCLQAHNKRFMALNNKMGLVGMMTLLHPREQGHVMRSNELAAHSLTPISHTSSNVATYSNG